MLDFHLGGTKTIPHIWKLLHPYITLINLFQNPCTYYPFLVPVLIWFSLIHPTVVKFTHSTLNTACHHQITNCKLNLDIEDPPPY